MQQIKRQRLAAVIAFTLALFDAAACAIAAEKPAKLRTAYVSPIGAMAPVWMAAASSAFQSEGIDGELVYIQSNAAIAALLAGEVDAVQISAPAIIPVVLAGGNAIMIAGLLNRMIFSFHAQKEIKSSEELRGKIVGADRIGTPNDYGVRSALAKLGLKPEIDVQLLRLGGSAIQWTALQSKQIAASALTPPVSFNADAQGYTRLADTYDLPYQNIGLVIRKTEIERRAETGCACCAPCNGASKHGTTTRSYRKVFWPSIPEIKISRCWRRLTHFSPNRQVSTGILPSPIAASSRFSDSSAAQSCRRPRMRRRNSFTIRESSTS